MFSRAELDEAEQLVHRDFPGTPQYTWPLLAERAGGVEIWVKHENHTPVGAFKLRGGLTYIDRLSRAGRPAGIISATRGNHGQSLAHAGRRAGLAVTIVVPHGNSTEKNAAMRAQGARLVEHGEDFEAAREEATRLAGAEGLHMVPSFHRDLVVGVATWALELFTTAPPLDALFVPIGLGSGICGAIRVRDLLGLRTEIIGVQATGSDPYARSFACGHRVEINRAETFADGIAVRSPDAEALAVIIAGAARIVTVDDASIAAAIGHYWTDTHNLAEGAGAAPLAALLQETARWHGRRVGLVLTGGNIDLPVFRQRVRPADVTAYD
jgi:threonine dehydratase